MAQLQETGVRAEIQDLDSFLAGFKSMNLAMAELARALAGISKQTAATTVAMQKTEEATNGLNKIIESISKDFISAAGSVGSLISALGGPAGLVIAIGAGVTIFKSITSTIEGFIQTAQQALQSLVQFGQEGLMLAGRFNEMENSAIAVGRSYGVMDDATRETIDTISDAGIRYDIAASSALQLIRNQIDLANATDLVAIAQATGIIIGSDSSETMGRLTHAIATGNTAMLGYMGILVKKEDIDAAALEMYGQTADALSQQEKMQARVNAIIKASVPIMGVYGSAMESPTKALRTLTGREIPTLGAVMMQTFIPAFKSGVETVRGIVKAITAAMEEGGSLYPILVNLGAAASLVAEGFKAASDWIVSWINNLQINISDGASNTIELMARWGADMIAIFAESIVQTAATLLTAAMQYVGSILSFWMAPGSPPRIAPEIDEWGAETINEWLHGMTKADYGALADIQSIIGKFLTGPEIISATAELTGFLAGERRIGEEFFRKIGKAAGFMGAEVIELVRSQLALAQVTEMVEMAERRLEESRQAVADAQDRTTALTREYNQLLREGAPPEVLEAKLAEINASEEQIGLAQEQVKEAEAAKEEAEGVLGPLQEQVELQKLLIAQLEKMAQTQKDVAKEADKAKAAGAVPELDIPTLDPALMGAEITNRVSEAVEAAKAALRAKLADIFAPVREAWANVQDDLRNVAGAFSEFKDNVSVAWARTWKFLQEQYQKFIVFWEENGARFQGIADAVFGRGGSGIGNVLRANFQFAFGAAEDAVSYGIDAILLVLEGFASTLTGDWRNLWDTNVKFFKRTIAFLKGLFTKWLNAFLSIFGTNIDEFVSQWRENWEMARTIVSTAVSSILTWISEQANRLVTIWNSFWERTRTAIQDKITQIKSTIMMWLSDLLDSMGLNLDEMKERWSNILSALRAIALEVWKKIVRAIKERVRKVRKTVEDGIEKLREWWNETWNGVREQADTIWSIIVAAVTEKVNAIRDIVMRIINRLKDWWNRTWNSLRDQVREVWDAIKGAIVGSEIYQRIVESLNTAFENVGTWIQRNIQRIRNIGIAIMEGLREGVLSTIGELIESITSSLEDALAAAKSYLGIACPDPSPLFAELGIGIGEGLALGISSMVPKIQSLIQLAVSPQAIGPVPMGAVTGGGTTNNRTTTINMGGVTIQNQMGMNEFRFRLERAILSGAR